MMQEGLTWWIVMIPLFISMFAIAYILTIRQTRDD